MQNCLSRCACFVVLVVIENMPRLLELFCGTKLAEPSRRGWEIVSLDIVLKFEPTILWSWDYALFPSGHFDDPLMWVFENPATGLLKTRPFMERLPWVRPDCVRVEP